jgi:hypothetical protein
VDLAGVIQAAGQGGGTQMRIGTITAYDQATGALTVSIGGTALPGVFYNPAYLPLVGDVVAVLSAGPTWYVMGSTTSTLARTVPVSAIVPAAEGTTSITYDDLATVGPAVTVMVGASGRVLVTIGANFGGISDLPRMSFDVSGANTAAASELTLAGAGSPGLTVNSGLSRTHLMTGLTQGLTTFTAKYRSDNGPNALFSNRTIVVQSL